MAKQCVIISKSPRFPSLPGTSDPVSINKAPLDYLFPHKDPLPQRDRLSRDHSAPPPPCVAEIKLALSMSSPTSAPGPDGGPLLQVEHNQPHQPWNDPGAPLPLDGLRLPTPLTKGCQWGGRRQTSQSLIRLTNLLPHPSPSGTNIKNP